MENPADPTLKKENVLTVCAMLPSVSIRKEGILHASMQGRWFVVVRDTTVRDTDSVWQSVLAVVGDREPVERQDDWIDGWGTVQAYVYDMHLEA